MPHFVWAVCPYNRSGKRENSYSDSDLREPFRRGGAERGENDTGGFFQQTVRSESPE
jgi:hypothetical protein